MTDKESLEFAHCNKCGHETKHEVLLERRQPGSQVLNEDLPEPPMTIDWLTTWTVLECRGCEAVTLKREFWFSEWGRGDEEIEYFPPRVSRRKPEWLENLPEPLQQLMNEIYVALHSDSRRLAVMGARTALDMFIVEKVGDKGVFPQKLKALQEEGYLSSRDRETLEAALDVGSAAAHRGHAPDSDHLSHVMDIVENVLQADRLASLADSIRDATPRRGDVGDDGG